MSHVGYLVGQVVRINDLKWMVTDDKLFEYGRWHHVALTWNQWNGVALYHNGMRYI